jgi:hypothetical protein
MHHFEALYFDEIHPDPTSIQTMLENIPSVVIEEQNKILLQEIDEEETKKSIWSLGKDKAWGPDGFSIHFYRIF